MYKVIVFAGTTEGYEISRWLSSHGIEVLSCVATDYGAASLEEGEKLRVAAGRLDKKEMRKLFQTEKPDLVVDATHPYASAVTGNIKEACREAAAEYLRVLRGGSGRKEEVVYVDSPAGAVEWLNQTEGNILLTTGSKELSVFTDLKDYQERIYARVLSLSSVICECKELGLEGRHLIGMQGPFSKEMNLAMLRQYDCCYLVTKDSGTAGGFQEKYEAALEAGAVLVVIGRPLQEEGLSLAEAKKKLAEKFCLKLCPKVTVLGIGMGSQETMTLEGQKACEEAELIIGAKRMVQAAASAGQAVYCAYRPEEICGYLREHPEYEKAVVVLSGDVGFYSGAKKLLELLEKQAQVTVLPGISSVSYFMAKVGLSWEDAKLVSAHGRRCNLISYIRNYPKVFAILGKADGIRVLAQKLCDYHMEQAILHVGENLSYENERIFSAKAQELISYEGDPLSVVCVENPLAVSLPSTHGIADEAFIRGKAPMTKEEIRCVSLGKLGLRPDSVCYDVGAGTGSVSVEMALRVPEGIIYAIEKKPEAVELLRENKRKFQADNLEIIQGTAPEAFGELEAPTHAFIGGSSGNLRQIIEKLTEKNPQVKMVINCITLETLSESLDVIKEFQLECTSLVQVAAARSKELGRYHMMMGENPIYIISCCKGGEE